MQAVLENAQKQAKEDKSKHMQKKRYIQDEINEENPETITVNNCSEQNIVEQKPGAEPKSCTEQKSCAEQKPGEEQTITSSEPKPQQNVPVSVTLELKEIPKVSEVDVTLQTSPSPSNRQKLLTPSKFRNQTSSSVAIQTEILK